MRFNKLDHRIMWLSIGLVFISCLLSACSDRLGILSPTVSVKRADTETVEPSAASTSRPTFSPVPSTPDATATETVTPPPSIIWAPGIASPMVMEGFRGVWSPVSNEIVGIQSKGRLTAGSLVLAQSPGFSTSLLDPLHPGSVWHKVTWSPDGKTILYGVVPDEQSDGFIIDIHSDIWTIEKSKTDPKPTRFTGQRALDFWGWMDDQTVVFTTYHGGGHEGITGWNINTDQIVASDTLSVYAKGTLTDQYAPVTGCDPTCTAYVVTKDENPSGEPCGIACQAKEFPRDPKVFPPCIEVSFQDWLPGQEKMLAASKGWDGKDTERARLFLWDVNTDQLTSVTAGGVYGDYSSDGKWLVWATYGPEDQYSANISGSIALDPINANEQIYLNIQDLETKQNILSVPVFAYTSFEASINGFLDPLYTFSPNNQWMTLVAPGRLQLDVNNWPEKVVTDNSSNWSFIVINLQTRQVVKTIEIHEKFAFERFRPIWSPNNKQFVYQDETGEWQLYQVDTASVLPITEGNGDLVKEPSWSYDGRYLQMISETPYFECDDVDCFRRTYVLDMKNGE